LVVRAFQHDPTLEGKLSLVGEGLVTSPIDFIDLHLGNPFFPILFVFADADGVLRGSALLTFPSLSRGGAHYPELLSSGSCDCANSGMDLFSVSDGLTKRLIRLIEREDVPTITAVQVALSRGSGTSLLFQPDFQLWLEKVAQVSVGARPADPNSGAEQFLGEEVVVRPVRGRDPDGAALILGCDMIPTIASLVELRRPSSAVASQTLLPLLITGTDPSQPAACIDLPGEMPEHILIENAVRWPQLKRIGTAPLPASFPPGAVLRQSARSLTDAELFIPVTKGEPTGGASGRPAISWLIETTGCAAQDLRRTLETLALQNGGSADSIIFIGPIARNILAGTRNWFATVKRFPSLSGAVASIETPLAGVIASGILLHNDRTADLFSELLESDAVATASCALISAPHGSWHVSIADLGDIQAADGSRLGRSERAHAAEHLWRCNYPVATPSRQLWVAQSGRVAGWSADASRSDVTVGMHLCTALVTASCVATKKPPFGQSFVPQAQQDQVTKVELLFG
jgi:hypothetical protein